LQHKKHYNISTVASALLPLPAGADGYTHHTVMKNVEIPGFT